MHVCEKKAFFFERASVTETCISFEYGKRKHWGNGKRIVHNAHTHIYFSVHCKVRSGGKRVLPRTVKMMLRER